MLQNLLQDSAGVFDFFSLSKPYFSVNESSGVFVHGTYLRQRYIQEDRGETF